MGKFKYLVIATFILFVASFCAAWIIGEPIRDGSLYNNPNNHPHKKGDSI